MARTKKRRVYHVSWAEYDHCTNSRQRLNCGHLGTFMTVELAWAKIRECIIEDVNNELANFDGGELPDDYKGKTAEQIADDWTYMRGPYCAGVECDNGVECWYDISCEDQSK